MTSHDMVVGALQDSDGVNEDDTRSEVSGLYSNSNSWELVEKRLIVLCFLVIVISSRSECACSAVLACFYNGLHASWDHRRGLQPTSRQDCESTTIQHCIHGFHLQVRPASRCCASLITKWSMT